MVLDCDERREARKKMVGIERHVASDTNCVQCSTLLRASRVFGIGHGTLTPSLLPVFLTLFADDVDEDGTGGGGGGIDSFSFSFSFSATPSNITFRLLALKGVRSTVVPEELLDITKLRAVARRGLSS